MIRRRCRPPARRSLSAPHDLPLVLRTRALLLPQWPTPRPPRAGGYMHLIPEWGVWGRRAIAGLSWTPRLDAPRLDAPRLDAPMLDAQWGKECSPQASNLGVQPGHPTWASNLGVQLGRPTRASNLGASNLGVQLGRARPTWASNLGASNLGASNLGVQLGRPTQASNSGVQLRRPTRASNLGASNLGVQPGRGRPTRASNSGVQLGQSGVQLYVNL